MSENPTIIKPTRKDDIKNAPTVKTARPLDEFEIMKMAFDKENRDIVMPVISADQYAAFRAYKTQMIQFFTDGNIDKYPEFKFFNEFEEFYKDALTAENGYLLEMIARMLEASKASEKKGIESGPGGGRSGWRGRLLGNH